MSNNEELKRTKDILQALLKSKKILRMYPSNNPIYLNTLEDTHGKFKDFFYYRDDLNLKIRQNEILFDTDQVYSNADKEDNLALFFFKDGLRELTFKKGLPYEEMEDFLRIISLDFNKDVMDDDIVTLFWEKDFQCIHYVVDDVVLSDEEDYEPRAVQEVKDKAADEDGLLQAYEDAFKEDEEVKDASIVPLSDKDLHLLMKELEADSRDKMEKMVDILFEMFHLSETVEDLEDLAGFFMNAVGFSIERGDIRIVTHILFELKQQVEDKAVAEETKRYMRKVILFAGSEEIINLLGEVLDSNQEPEDKVIEEFIRFLDKNAIVPFMRILGELKSIHARKIVIDALIFLGNKDIMLLARGLNDSRWYVVRNIIFILRKIGDKRAVDYLLKTIRHGDIRVKKEVIRTLGELGGAGVLQALRECLDDAEMQVRSSALKAMGSIGSEATKKIVLNKISDNSFKDKDFDEKKEYFEVLSRWKDGETYDFLVSIIKKKTFFGRAKNIENQACAVYCLGLIGNKEALPLLSKFRNDSNKLLREFSHTAVKRLEYGQ